MAFVLGRIAEKENIQVTREELSNYIYHMAQERQVKPEKLINDLKKADGIRKIQEQILLSKVVDFLERSAKIEDSAPPSEPANAS